MPHKKKKKTVDASGCHRKALCHKMVIENAKTYHDVCVGDRVVSGVTRSVGRAPVVDCPSVLRVSTLNKTVAVLLNAHQTITSMRHLA